MRVNRSVKRKCIASSCSMFSQHFYVYCLSMSELDCCYKETYNRNSVQGKFMKFISLPGLVQCSCYTFLGLYKMPLLVWVWRNWRKCWYEVKAILSGNAHEISLPVLHMHIKREFGKTWGSLTTFLNRCIKCKLLFLFTWHKCNISNLTTCVIRWRNVKSYK